MLDVINAPLDWLPEVPLLPDQAPEAVQEVALVEDQVSVEDAPLATEVGFAVSDTVGSGPLATVTVAEALAVPPDPVQARTNVLDVINAPLDWLPEVALLPDQAPEAVQEVALVEDQVSVEDAPFAIEVGFAVRDTVGGGALDTVTVVEALALPPEPVQVRE